MSGDRTSATTYVLASEATSGSALLTQVLIRGAAFWVIVAIVAWANGGSLTTDVRTRRCGKQCELR
jgi:hypothetical protein